MAQRASFLPSFLFVQFTQILALQRFITVIFIDRFDKSHKRMKKKNIPPSRQNHYYFFFNYGSQCAIEFSRFPRRRDRRRLVKGFRLSITACASRAQCSLEAWKECDWEARQWTATRTYCARSQYIYNIYMYENVHSFCQLEIYIFICSSSSASTFVSHGFAAHRSENNWN